MSDEPQNTRPPGRSRRQRLLWLLPAALGAVGLALWLGRGSRPPGVAKKPGMPAVPVTTTTAYQGDIGVSVEALGTVTPVYTVNVISRVQGQITSILYHEGQDVKKGDPLVEIDPRPYKAALLQAQGLLDHDLAVLLEAQVDLRRYRLAYATRAIPRQQLDDQEQVVRQDQGTVTADQGALATAQVNLAYCHITSPIDGRVGLRLVDLGNMVQANSTTPLVSVTQIAPITVIFSIAEDVIPDVQKAVKDAPKEALDVEALDRSAQKKLATGSFLTLDNQIDTTTGTVRVRALFDNKDAALFPNQFVNAKLKLRTQHQATLVSSQAVQRGSQGAYVYVIKADKTAEMRKVKVGTVDGPLTAVEGISPGDVIAANGFDKLQDKAEVVAHDERGEAGRVP